MESIPSGQAVDFLMGSWQMVSRVPIVSTSSARHRVECSNEDIPSETELAFQCDFALSEGLYIKGLCKDQSLHVLSLDTRLS